MAVAAAPRSVQGQAVADLTTDGWDDDDLIEGPRTLPSREDQRPYKTPVYYWEPEFPGMALMPFARLGHFDSSPQGLWATTAKYQEDDVRKRLSRLGDPDQFKVTEEELAVLRGKASGESRYCHSGVCRFQSCNPFVIRLHETLREHTTKPEPRKDR